MLILKRLILVSLLSLTNSLLSADTFNEQPSFDFYFRVQSFLSLDEQTMKEKDLDCAENQSMIAILHCLHGEKTKGISMLINLAEESDLARFYILTHPKDFPPVFLDFFDAEASSDTEDQKKALMLQDNRYDELLAYPYDFGDLTEEYFWRAFLCQHLEHFEEAQNYLLFLMQIYTIFGDEPGDTLARTTAEAILLTLPKTNPSNSSPLLKLIPPIQQAWDLFQESRHHESIMSSEQIIELLKQVPNRARDSELYPLALIAVNYFYLQDVDNMARTMLRNEDDSPSLATFALQDPRTASFLIKNQDPRENCDLTRLLLTILKHPIPGALENKKTGVDLAFQGRFAEALAYYENPEKDDNTEEEDDDGDGIRTSEDIRDFLERQIKRGLIYWLSGNQEESLRVLKEAERISYELIRRGELFFPEVSLIIRGISRDL